MLHIAAFKAKHLNLHFVRLIEIPMSSNCYITAKCGLESVQQKVCGVWIEVFNTSHCLLNSSCSSLWLIELPPWHSNPTLPTNVVLSKCCELTGKMNKCKWKRIACVVPFIRLCRLNEWITLFHTLFPLQTLPQHGRIQSLWPAGGEHRKESSRRTQGQFLSGGHHMWLRPS